MTNCDNSSAILPSYSESSKTYVWKCLYGNIYMLLIRYFALELFPILLYPFEVQGLELYKVFKRETWTYTTVQWHFLFHFLLLYYFLTLDFFFSQSPSIRTVCHKTKIFPWAIWSAQCPSLVSLCGLFYIYQHYNSSAILLQSFTFLLT